MPDCPNTAAPLDSFSIACLGSGSSGNCSVLRLETGGACRHILIDAGLSVRRTKASLEQLGVALEDIDDVLLTHLDFDHFRPAWIKALDRFELRINLHRRHRNRATTTGIPDHRIHCFDDDFQLDASAHVTFTILAHDALGSIGYVVEHAGLRLGYATDVGTISQGLLDTFGDLHALAIESNYDRHLQLTSGRPQQLTRRIMSGLGHISNEQSIRAVNTIEQQSNLSQLMLLHLSQQCNCPGIVRRLYEDKAPHLLDRLTITSQAESTKWLPIDDRNPRQDRPALHGEQLALF